MAAATETFERARGGQAFPLPALSDNIQHGGQPKTSRSHTQHGQPTVPRVRQKVLTRSQPQSSHYASRARRESYLSGVWGRVCVAGKSVVVSCTCKGVFN